MIRLLILLALLPATVAAQQPVLCYAPGTTDAYVEEAEARAYGTSLAQKYQFEPGNRWGETASASGLQPGDPTVLTWSIVPDGTPISGWTGEPTSPSELESWLTSVYGSRDLWFPLIERAINEWAAETGLTFIYEPNDDGAAFVTSPGELGVRGDIRLSAHPIDGTSGILAYNFYPELGDMVLDSADGVLESLSDDSLILRNVVSHEVGHGLGFYHVCPVERTKLMEPFLTTAFEGPQPDDLLATHYGYGDRFETNDGFDGATLIEVPGAALGVSLDDVAEQDVFSTEALPTIETASHPTWIVEPLGGSYLSGPQAGGCSSGELFNAGQQIDLAIDLYDQNGTLLTSVDATGPGGVEQAAAEGTVYAVVRGSAAEGPAQRYSLSVVTDDPPPPPESFTLTAVIEGSGTVTSDPLGIDCPGDCTQDYEDGTVVELTATPADGWLFAGWTEPDCPTVTMDQDRTCTATFEEEAPPPPPDQYLLTVSVKGPGGTVTSDPEGLDCRGNCTVAFPSGTVVTLTATPDEKSRFNFFKGEDPDCEDGVVTLDRDVFCRVHFKGGGGK